MDERGGVRLPRSIVWVRMNTPAGNVSVAHIAYHLFVFKGWGTGQCNSGRHWGRRPVCGKACMNGL